MMRGDDVKGLQWSLNERLAKAKLGWKKVDEDGIFGPATADAARLVGYIMGERSQPELKKAARGTVVQPLQRLVRRQRERGKPEERRAKRRHKKIRKLREQHGKGATAAVEWALDQRGVVEQPANSNRGPLIDIWQKAVDMIAQPWCGAFTHYASKEKGGASGLTWRLRYTPYGLADARAGINGFVGAVAKEQAQPGDHAFFNFSGGAVPQHTGLVVKRVPGGLLTIEGNTSSGNSGSQSNGGGVFLRTRPDWIVCGVGRPRY